jgi:tetratricopeptide (TPR) repeat protein
MRCWIAALACAVLIPSPVGLGQLANDGKRGLYVTSIEEVLRLNDDEVDLATAALIVSEHWSDLVHGRRYLDRLDDMALDIQERLKANWLKPNYKAIPVINKYLFRELRLRSVSEAINPNDLFLHNVLDKKRGYCLSLSILYLSLGERLGMPLYGVVVPGHFFVRYDDGRTRINIETTSNGGSALDKHYIEKFNVPPGDSSMYLKNLTKIQTLGCLFNNLGNSYTDIGDEESAFLALLRAVEINPTLSESRANLGNIYLKRGQVDDAILEYQAALEINPNDPKTHNNLGNAYTERGWMTDAIAAYTQSIDLDPNFIDPYKNLAVAYSKLTRFGQAIVHLKQALALQPKDAGCYYQLGEVYFQSRNYNDAIYNYKKALALKRDFAEASFGIGICYNKLGKVDDEILAYRRALVTKPDMLPALANLGNAYFAKENYAAAIQQYRRASEIKPDDSSIYYNLGAAYSNSANHEEAVTAYLKAVGLDPKMGDAHRGLAFGYYMLKKYDLAWKHISTAKELGVAVTDDQLNAIKSKLR